jgi:hypothetical protein
MWAITLCEITEAGTYVVTYYFSLGSRRFSRNFLIEEETFPNTAHDSATIRFPMS